MQNQPSGEPGKPSELIENALVSSVASDSASVEGAPVQKLPQKPQEERPEKGKRLREVSHNDNLEKDRESKNSLKYAVVDLAQKTEPAEPEVRKPVPKRPMGAEKPKSPSLQPEPSRPLPGDRAGSLEERLREEYRSESERRKEELFEMDYCYWDTTNIVKKLKRKKKEKCIDLLNLCRLELIEHFQALIKSEPEELLLVIRDFIVPHNMSIEEVEVLHIKTKTGEPVLNFKKVKVPCGPTETKGQKELDVSVQTGGPARIIQRSRYEKSKNLYPFHNWHTLQLPRK